MSNVQSIASLLQRTRLPSAQEQYRRTPYFLDPVTPPAPPWLYGYSPGRWQRPGGGAVDYVSIHPCTNLAAANVASAISINVALPTVSDRDPAVFSGDVIRFNFDCNGSAVAIEPFSSEKIGSLRDFHGDWSAIPEGWTFASGTMNAIDARGRVRVTKFAGGDADGLFSAVNQTGGYNYHGGDGNDHDDHGPLSFDVSDKCDFVQSGSGAQVLKCTGTYDCPVFSGAVNGDLSHTQTDNRMKFIVVGTIERTF